MGVKVEKVIDITRKTKKDSRSVSQPTIQLTKFIDLKYQ